MLPVLCGSVLLAATLGCGGDGAEAAVDVDWSLQPDPPRVGPATLTLSLADSAGHPITGAAVQVEGNMSHAGMQPVFVEASETEAGRYATSLEFTMAGDWYLLVTVTLPEGRTVEHVIEVPGVGAP